MDKDKKVSVEKIKKEEEEKYLDSKKAVTAPKAENNNVSVNAQPKSQRKIIACCLIIFILFLASLPLLAIQIDKYSKNLEKADQSATKTSTKKIPTTTSSTSKTVSNERAVTTDTSYPTPQDCAQVEIPDSVALSININDPGVKKNATDRYYSIFGYTNYDLRRQVVACGPKQDGRGYAGMATSWFNWTYTYQYTPNGYCQVIKPTVGINVDIWLPGWEPTDSIQPGLADDWNIFMANLQTHENGHKDYHFSAADQIYNSINGLTATTCDEVGHTADATINNIIDQDGVNNKAYDSETSHGMTQNAIMP